MEKTNKNNTVVTKNTVRKENIMKVTWKTSNGNESSRELTGTKVLMKTQNGVKEFDAFAIKGYDDIAIQPITEQDDKGRKHTAYRLVLIGAGMYVNKKNGGSTYRTIESACQYGIRHALKVKRDNIDLYNQRVKELAALTVDRNAKQEKKVAKKSTKKVDRKSTTATKVDKKSTQKTTKEVTWEVIKDNKRVALGSYKDALEVANKYWAKDEECRMRIVDESAKTEKKVDKKSTKKVAKKATTTKKVAKKSTPKTTKKATESKATNKGIEKYGMSFANLLLQK